MSTPIRIAILSAALAITSGHASAKTPQSAVADLKTADGKSVGQAKFTSRTGGVWMAITVKGVEPGVHGLHLHAVGTCTGPDFASAGGHWNPMHKMHGRDAPNGAHLGDLPNLTIDAKGKGRLDTLIAGATIESGEMGLLNSDGTALVIHAKPDDNMTDPSGNSGGRIICGAVTER